MSTKADSSLSLDLARIERLVGQMEASSTALVKYRYAERPQPRRRASKIVTIGGLAAVWLSSLVLTIAYVLTPPPSAEKRVTHQRIISPVPNRKAQKLATSVHPLAKALAPSSHRPPPLKATVANEAATPSAAAGVPQIQPCDRALPHRVEDGTAYWVVPSGPYGNSPTNIIAVGKTANGVVVRSLADKRYYTVTPVCGWRRIPIPRSAN